MSKLETDETFVIFSAAGLLVGLWFIERELASASAV